MSSLKSYKDYIYDIDYNFYYNDGKNLYPITRKEYKEKTGESDYIVDKLRNSRYPYQKNDYFFLKLNNDFYTPIDWKIYNLVKFFWDNGFKGYSSEQGHKFTSSSITFNLKYNKNLILYIESIFDKKNIEIYDYNFTGLESTKIHQIRSELNLKILNEKKKIIYISKEILKENTLINIQFRPEIIDWIYHFLNLKIPDHFKAHTGGRIIHKRWMEKFKKYIVED